MKKYLVWDWNGTLFDDVPTCLAVMNDMLARRGLPLIRGEEHYRELFTFPVSEYYQRAGLDFTREPFEALAGEYIEDYNRRAKSCRLYSGAERVLDELSALGVRQLIASASEQTSLESQVGQFGIENRFEALLGIGNSYGGGKAGLARAYFQERGADLKEALFVGDTTHDFEVAKEMGCGCVLIAAGHQDRSRLEATGAPVLESVRELPGYWKKEAAR